MPDIAGWPATQPLRTARLQLEPMRVEDAAEMAPLLDDQRLHTFIGGGPDTVDELQARYARQVAGPPADRCERWFNWILRSRTERAAVGTVQATVTSDGGVVRADVAWVIGSAYQRRGYAREAATAITTWLRENGADAISAHIHPDHEASMAVARAIGLRPTNVHVDGEVRWTS